MDDETPKTPLDLTKSIYLSANCGVKSIDCDFKIHDFSLSSLNKIIESSVFSKSDANETKWKLQLFPKGDVSEESSSEQNDSEEDLFKDKITRYVSIYLYLIDCKDPNIKVSCTYSIIKNGSSAYNRSFIHCFESKGKGFGISKFIKYDDLFKKRYLTNDTLRISSKIKYSTSKLNCHIENGPDLYVNLENTYKDWNKDISSLYEDEIFSDVCLEVDDVKFRVHKNILATRSSVFKAIFLNDMKEKQENVIKIREMRPEVMKAIIRFIYTGLVDKIEAKALDLLKAADMYDIKGLKLLYENSLSKSLTVNNAAEILDWADVYTAENLKRNSLSFIKDNLSEVIKTSTFLNFKGSQSCLIDIFKSITK